MFPAEMLHSDILASLVSKHITLQPRNMGTFTKSYRLECGDYDWTIEEVSILRSYIY